MKTPIKNFRDMGGLETTDGRTTVYGKIYRTRQLVDIKGKKLVDWIKRTGIRTIVDFRTLDEMDEYGWYPADITNALSYHNLPLKCSGIYVDRELKDRRGYDGYEYLYYHLTTNEGDVFRKVFELVANPATHPIAIHCIAGKDRTGIFASMLLMVLNVTKESVKKDYLLTENAEEKNIEHLYSLIEDRGGIVRYLESIGIPRGIISKLRRMLLT